MVCSTLSRRQIYLEWRECLRWECEERRERHYQRVDLYRTAGKTFDKIPKVDWKKFEPDWKALYPERKQKVADFAKGKTQRQLYEEARDSGRLAIVRARAESPEAVQRRFKERQAMLRAASRGVGRRG